MRFFIRRGLKIYPGFYWMLFLTVIWIYRYVPMKNILTEALFVQNYLMGISNIWNHTWSLAIEEHFYFLLAMLLFFLSRSGGARPFKEIPLIFIGVAVLCLAWRVWSYGLGVPPVRLYVWTHYRLDSLGFGVFLSYLWHFHHEALRAWIARWRPWLLVPAAISFALAASIKIEGDPFMNTYGLTVLYLGFGALLLLALDRDPRPGASRLIRALGFIGFYSYSIYLWHVPWRKVSLAIVNRYFHWHLGFYGEAALYLASAICEGVLMAVLIELPFLKWRDRRFPARSTRPSPASS